VFLTLITAVKRECRKVRRRENLNTAFSEKRTFLADPFFRSTYTPALDAEQGERVLLLRTFERSVQRIDAALIFPR